MIFKPLFGDRRKFGTSTDPHDADYCAWQKSYMIFYKDNQKASIGQWVNHLSFDIVKYLDLSEKIVLEVGPGILEHLKYNSTKPKEYIIADIKEDFLKLSEEQLKRYGIDHITKLKVQGINIPLGSNAVDMVISFHQLEHILELKDYLAEIKRVLRPDGILAGAVPCEGGLGWGIGRYLTSRRYVRRYLNFNYDKIICWEHPNFVDRIKSSLDREFIMQKSRKRPFPVLPMDLNLSWSFIYRNNK
jgi:SAM-dependent methyltransferase